MDVRRAKLKDGLVWGALGAWGLTMVVLCAYLLGGHLLTLPSPSVHNPKLEAALSELGSSGEWRMLHVLYGECGCSRQVINHLLTRGPSALADEHVVLVDPREGDVAELIEAGWRDVQVLPQVELGSRFDISAAPLLVIQAPEHSLQYVGGYTGRKRGPDIQDLRILRQLQAGQAPNALPLFGCAVNAELARAIDPLGLR